MWKARRWDQDGNNVPKTTTDEGTGDAEVVHSRNYVWDANALAWVRETQPTGGGGGGGAVTIADGADVAQGTTTDPSSASTVIGLLKAVKAAVTGTLATSRTWTLSSGTDSVNVGNFPASQTVSGTVTANQGTAGATAWKVDGSAVTQPVSGTFWQTTQPVSAASLPLPAGASTDAHNDTLFGSPTSDRPGAYSVLDQLSRIRSTAIAQQTLLQQLVALQTPAPKPKGYTTLLHRSI
jgi:hypothetical protein